mgnify:CR=1 FL=1
MKSTKLVIEQPKEEEKPKHPVAARNRLTLGEDYDDDEEAEKNKEEEEMRRAMEEKKLRKAARRKEKSRERGGGESKNLPTYDQLIKSTLESEDKGFASDND